MAKWVDKYNPSLVIDRLEKARSVNEKGNAIFDAPVYTECLSMLNSMISLDQKIPEFEKSRLISKSTFNVGRSTEIKSSSLLKEISKLERDYLKSPVKNYCIIADISVNRSFVLPRLRYAGSSLVFPGALSKKFTDARREIFEYAKNSFSGEIPDNYSIAKINIKSRSVSEAVESSLQNLDFVRGIWNLCINGSQSMRISSGKRKPVNRIVLGPLHSIHDPMGYLASEFWWYEPQYHGPIEPLKEKKFNVINKYLASVRELLKNNSYRNLIERCVIRYVRALDSIDWEGSFLSLWGVLETLTGTKSDSYDVTIKRSSFIYKDREYAKQVLLHLRDYRNQTVHMGAASDNVEAYMYQLKNIVERHIEFHIAHGRRFESHDEVVGILSLSPEKSYLSKMRKKINFANSYLFD